MATVDTASQRRQHVLSQLASAYGLATSYRDSSGHRRDSPESSLLVILGALGAPVDRRGGIGDLERALALRQLELGRRLIEPVLLAREGVAPALRLHLPESWDAKPGSRLRLTLMFEDGRSLQRDIQPDSLRATPGDAATAMGAGYLSAHLLPPRFWSGAIGRLPLGYHRLRIEAAGLEGESTVIAAPRRCYRPSRHDEGLHQHEDPPPWGVFAPLYGLPGEQGCGAGDLADLGWLCAVVGRAGGRAVATLPLLAAFLDGPFEPAPYRPVSRMFWNEFYLAVEDIPEFGSCEPAQGAWHSEEAQARMGQLREACEVDYREVMTLKRVVLGRLAEHFFAEHGEGGDGGDARWAAFRAYLAAHPEAEGYARFRAEVERQRADWREWPQDASPPTGCVNDYWAGGCSAASSGDWNSAERYHLYCQWQTEEQLAAIADSSGAAGLFLDLPVGAHPGGYDTWRWPGLFLDSISTGAPPDDFFSLGQDWDFPPLHPQRARETGHAYFAACLRTQMRHADYLRVDHVMGLHRLFVIPEGEDPTAGAYLEYPADEMYAVLALESQRARTVVAGEDLGTVPPGVRAAMHRHAVSRTWVLQASLRPRAGVPAASVPPHAVASVNTHDMFPFAGFLEGRDIRARVETGQLDAEAAAAAAASRETLARRLDEWLDPEAGRVARSGSSEAVSSPARLLPRALAHMARGPAGLILVSLDDLLWETEPQNLPGTGAERPNWRRKIRASPAAVEESIRQAARWLRR